MPDIDIDMLKLFWHWLWDNDNHCINCEFLRDLLEQERRNNRSLMESLLSFNRAPMQIQEEKTEQHKPVTTYTSWRVKQQMMEQEDRVKAEVLRKKTEELENELGIGESNASEKQEAV